LNSRVDGYGYAGKGTGGRWRVHGRRVNGYGYNGFFPKKNMTCPSQTRTRVLVYPPIPEHRYEYRTRVHEYGLYPVGFSKLLDGAQMSVEEKNPLISNLVQFVFYAYHLKVNTNKEGRREHILYFFPRQVGGLSP
jgi:hypothetical protein